MKVDTSASPISSKRRFSSAIFTVCPPTLMARRKATYQAIGSAPARGDRADAHRHHRRPPAEMEERGVRVDHGEGELERLHVLPALRGRLHAQDVAPLGIAEVEGVRD